MVRSNHLQEPSAYLQLYKYLPVLTEEEISKLANIAIGVRDLSAVREEEIHVLEAKLQLMRDDLERQRK